MRLAAAGGLIALVTTSVAPFASASGREDERVVIAGVGSAHGLGLAMDGVQNQARAGWTHDRILSLFYRGTSTGHASGTIRVGLAEGPTQSFRLPSGGEVISAPSQAKGGPPLRMTVPPKARLTLAGPNGRIAVHLDTVAQSRTSSTPTPQPDKPKATPKPTPQPTPRPSPGASPAPSVPAPAPVAAKPGIDEPDTTPPPILPATPGPREAPTPEPERRVTVGRLAHGSVLIVPHGEPALTEVEATGHLYRGVIVVQRGGGGLRVMDRVGLETYVNGIAEEKGAGWPLEGMKVLAIAARSLAAASMTWHARNHDNGYDICPTQNCQVYLGYDGEEPIMRRAVAETAGQIRTYAGRPILAMYHGNGGGMTESYYRVSRGDPSSFPYLRSVRYPYAKPSRWRRDTTMTEIANAVGGPAGLRKIEILERGDSPRVIRMRLVGAHESHEMSGTAFMSALNLWSTWFDIGVGPNAERVLADSSLGLAPDDPNTYRTGSRSWAIGALAAVVLVVAVVCARRVTLLPTAWAGGLLVRWPRRRRAG